MDLLHPDIIAYYQQFASALNLAPLPGENHLQTDATSSSVNADADGQLVHPASPPDVQSSDVIVTSNVPIFSKNSSLTLQQKQQELFMAALRGTHAARVWTNREHRGKHLRLHLVTFFSDSSVAHLPTAQAPAVHLRRPCPRAKYEVLANIQCD